MRATAWFRAFAAAALAAVACTNGGEDRVLGIGATGTVTGFALVDANGSRLIDAGDDSLPGVQVRLVFKSGRDSGLVQTTASNGSFRFRNVPVGEYALKLDTTGFADTMQIVKVDSASFTVAPAETVLVNILAGRPLLNVAQARASAAGRRVFVTGVALTASGAFADSTAFVADTSGSIRVARARTAFAVGDSVRLLGAMGQRDGEPVLADPTVIALGHGFPPTATSLTSAVAATASGGARDAQLVSVKGVTISDTSSTATSFVLTVSDGSGPLQAQLDQTADQAFTTASLPGNFVPGNKFDLLGVLVPTGSDSWRLRPRTALDLTLIPAPPISIAAARALPPGTLTYVVGVALNTSGTFSDTTVSLADTSGAIRLTRLRGTLTVGDSVKVRATVGARAGQPTLDAGTATPLGSGLLPTAATLTTAQAAAANGGTRDAQVVVVDSAAVTTAATVVNGYQLTATDGSGSLTVFLDARAGFSVPGVYVPGNSFRMVGLLVPTGTGSWVLRPRSAADLTLIPPTVISIAAARARPAGTVVNVVGVALNGTATFSDSTVSLADTSGAIRLTRLRATVAAGDSVQVRATTSSRAGEPTLDAGTTTPLGTGLAPAAPTLKTAVAASAAGGTRDAQLVVVDSAVVSDTASVLGGFRLTVSDGSGNLTVLLDQQGGFAVPGVYVPANRFRIVGLLVPTGTGSWMLKPRSAADLQRF